MKRARYYDPETGTVKDVLVAQRDACGVWDISTLPPRRPPDMRPPQPRGADFWQAQSHPDGNPFLRYGAC